MDLLQLALATALASVIVGLFTGWVLYRIGVFEPGAAATSVHTAT
jgi:hypothetical protein